ncbi:DUF2267 domain-containing protein [Caldovatus aquaticus]|uniref:DUF2267 domain-containing protein n=1 Tax=Caldovatus aquaticus TaxID=2865671 RepID=A0ABS7EZ96_9PROT|nr:DUF2267 domain-containing protein [Caldovatus aquaticus]MBW8268696.1 DUF2267 domain-containing protein [Caldovatus aquaticus]
MASAGLEVFDRTLQITHVWLGEIEARLGPDRHLAWRALGAVLHALRDRVPADLAAHVGAQLPLLVRGLYYEGFDPSRHPDKARTLEAFLERVKEGLAGTRPVAARDAAQAVLRVLAHHLDPGQVGKLARALPEPVRDFWAEVAAIPVPTEEEERPPGHRGGA